MNVPKPLENETPKAYRAFTLYVEQGEDRGMRKLARHLHCSHQNLSIWAKKYRWQERIAAQRLSEAEHKNTVERQAVEAQVGITEERRAHVAQRAFAVAARMINVADELMERHP